jgi:hypothetical protein
MLVYYAFYETLAGSDCNWHPDILLNKSGPVQFTSLITGRMGGGIGRGEKKKNHYYSHWKVSQLFSKEAKIEIISAPSIHMIKLNLVD